MSKMITVASGFQYSVNIGYDLNNDDKLKNFIPTKSALGLMEDVLLSTNPTSNERARVLVGAYGKGKSHIVLTILAMLMKRDLELFKKAMPRIKGNPRLYQCVQNYYESDNKILPVIITGSNTSLSQAFLLALHRTLSMNGLLNVMPETNYKAAVNVIERWKKEFPDTYQKLKSVLDIPVDKFVEELQNYSIGAYEKFEKVYPTLTAGSLFNPFIGFDVVDLYEEAIKGLKTKGYTGLYVIYDEFSKFLETNITEALVSDTKMLQDFAEKCNRSGELQMHLLLISHKEIANYIDKLPKQKIDGWRGVSERFKHIHLNNNFTQTYEIVESAIQKKKSLWNSFCKEFENSFVGIFQLYQTHKIFNDLQDESIERTIYGCYPLHPVSTFILPRLSERVAQNERTLFTFISAPGISTLPSFLETYNDDCFALITPDCIYDYFEPLLKKEIYSGNIHETYRLTEVILEKLVPESLESKVVKTLSLIYILEQFEKLQPSKDELVSIYSTQYSVDEIDGAIDNLIQKEYVIYLKRSNNFLRLKQTSGIDVRKKISDLIETQKNRITIKETLNNSNFDNYMYPSRYNNERDMTRFFAFEFIDEEEITESIDWKIKSEGIEADGVIYGIIPHSEASIRKIKEVILKTSINCNRHIFIVPKHYSEIENIIREFNAVSVLRDEANDDKVLFDEYEVIYEDLREVINLYMRAYTRPEEYRADYIFEGQEVPIRRKAALTELMSGICDNVFSLTPVINNEAMNKNEITSIANNSRSKIIAALLRNELESNLGFTGTGQEVSIMRSTLIRTGVWEENNGVPRINLHPTSVENMDVLLSTIENFIIETRENGKMSFSELYKRLLSPEYHIGLRKGFYAYIERRNYPLERLAINQRTVTNHLRNAKHIVFDKNNYARYCEADPKVIWERIDFTQYKDLVISTELIYKDYAELMDELDIRDGYELFYIIKSSMGNLDNSLFEMNCRRVPVMVMGEGSEECQAIQLLKEISPVDFQDYYEAYEERFGVRKESAQGNPTITGALANYYTEGLYVIDVPAIDEKDIVGFKEVLAIKNFWFTDELEREFKRVCVKSSEDAFNSAAFKRIGYS